MYLEELIRQIRIWGYDALQLHLKCIILLLVRYLRTFLKKPKICTCLPIRVYQFIVYVCTKNRKIRIFTHCYYKSCFKETRLWLVLINYCTCIYIWKLISTIPIVLLRIDYFYFSGKRKTSKKRGDNPRDGASTKGQKRPKERKQTKTEFYPYA